MQLVSLCVGKYLTFRCISTVSLFQLPSGFSERWPPSSASVSNCNASSNFLSFNLQCTNRFRQCSSFCKAGRSMSLFQIHAISTWIKFYSNDKTVEKNYSSESWMPDFNPLLQKSGLFHHSKDSAVIPETGISQSIHSCSFNPLLSEYMSVQVFWLFNYYETRYIISGIFCPKSDHYPLPHHRVHFLTYSYIVLFYFLYATLKK
jgi:hypothetical protein